MLALSWSFVLEELVIASGKRKLAFIEHVPCAFYLCSLICCLLTSKVAIVLAYRWGNYHTMHSFLDDFYCVLFTPNSKKQFFHMSTHIFQIYLLLSLIIIFTQLPQKYTLVFPPSSSLFTYFIQYYVRQIRSHWKYYCAILF